MAADAIGLIDFDFESNALGYDGGTNSPSPDTDAKD